MRITQAIKRRTGVALLLVLLIPALPSTTVQAAAYCVNPGGTGGCFATIQAAVNVAASGDTIAVAAGNYDEAVTINQSLTLVGAGMGMTTLDHHSLFDGCSCITVNSGTVKITGLTIKGNVNGGGVINFGQTTLLDSTVMENNDGAGNGAGGTLTVVNSTVSYNNYGISNSGNLTIVTSNINRNDKVGISNEDGGTTVVSGTTVAYNGVRNQNGGGGALNFGTMTISASTITANQAAAGGGIENWGTLLVINTTISNNTMTVVSPQPDYPGPGIFSFAGTVTLVHATVSNNTAPAVQHPQAIAVLGGSMTIANSILVNQRGDCVAPATLLSGDYNVTYTGCFSTPGIHDRIADAGLYTLADNGGPTQTQAISIRSTAFDLIPVGNLNCPATDQRGVTRPKANGCDAGAFELVPPAPQPIPPSRAGIGSGSPQPMPEPRVVIPIPTPLSLPPHR